jgi:general secretion pathway protein D
VVRVINSLQQGQGQPEGGGPGGPATMKLVADERSNSILVSGEPAARLRTKTLVAYLDTPLEAGGDTRVRYLQYADAEKMAAKLKEQVTGIAQAAAPAGGGGGGQAAPPPPSQQIDKSTTIWADPQTNALVVTAPPKVMKQLMSVVDRLDIRRLQVLVEAIIVDVSINKNAELGVNWAVFSDDDDSRIPLGTFLSPVGGASLVDLVNAVDNPASAASSGLNRGTTIGIGRIAAGNGVSFAAMLRALRNDDNSNIIGTPSALTMDNEEAEIKVAQEVPFRTGQFTNTAGNVDGSVNPFTTIERQEVGTILKITPQINEGGTTVMLKLELESSTVAQTQITGAADLITNKRTINTNVLIEDGGIVVLGGLISDNFSRGESRVPFLGRIPIVGLAFKTRNSTNNKTNLMFFIRPKIIRDGVDAAIETDSKYRFIREQQRKTGGRELVPLLPGVKAPILPPLPPPPTERPPTQLPPSETENEGTNGQSEAQKKEAQAAPADQPQAAPQPAPSSRPREDGNE